MDKEKINRIIAEFMGFHKIELIDDETPDCLYCKICGPEKNVLEHPFLEPHHCNIQTKMPDYTDSLDALIPVWDKFEYLNITLEKQLGNVSCCCITDKKFKEHEFCSNNIKEAACIATVIAIEEYSENFS